MPPRPNIFYRLMKLFVILTIFFVQIVTNHQNRHFKSLKQLAKKWGATAPLEQL